MTREVLINGKWPLMLCESSATEWEGNMAFHDGGWEVPRLNKLEELIKTHYAYDPVVLYVGAYKGDMPALLHSWGAKLILIEGSDPFWGLIRDTWEANGFEKPLGMFNGLVASETNTQVGELTDWPEHTQRFIEGHSGFVHLAESGGKGVYPERTIDDICLRLGVMPDIITMDIEGSELEALKGATKVLSHHPELVLSIHPEFIFHNHGDYERDVHDLIEQAGYKKGEHLDYDHEHHYHWSPK